MPIGFSRRVFTGYYESSDSDHLFDPQELVKFNATDFRGYGAGTLLIRPPNEDDIGYGVVLPPYDVWLVETVHDLTINEYGTCDFNALPLTFFPDFSLRRF